MNQRGLSTAPDRNISSRMRARTHTGDLPARRRHPSNPHEMGTDKLSKKCLAWEKFRLAWVHETFAVVGSLERFVGKTCDLPLRIARGGSQVCFWRCREGAVPDLPAHV